jgi:hypothetical protein
VYSLEIINNKHHLQYKKTQHNTIHLTGRNNNCVRMRPKLSSNSFSTTSTRSFRFDVEYSKILDEEAERMGISVNALVGIILRGYTDFTRYLSKIDMIVLNREFLTSLLESSNEESLYNLGMKLGERVPIDTIMFWKKDLTEKSVLEYIEKIICRYGHLGTYDEISQSGSRIIVIRHRLGRKGSKFFEGYLRSTLKNTVGKDAIFEVTESSMKFEILYT